MDSDNDMDSDEFSFEDSFADTPTSKGKGGGKDSKEAKSVANNHYDEALDLSSSTIMTTKTAMGQKQGSDDEDGDNVVKNKHYDEALDLSSSTIMTTKTMAGGDAGGEKQGENREVLQNERWDEAHSLSDDEDLDDSVDTHVHEGRSANDSSPRGDSMGGSEDYRGGGDTPPESALDSSFGKNEYERDNDKDNMGMSSESDSDDANASKKGGGGGGSGGRGNPKLSSMNNEDSESDESTTESEDPEASSGFNREGYNPSQYERLNVSSDIQDLFQYIGLYKPPGVELETQLRCFFPDYIPAVGEIDAFIKAQRPDGKGDGLGYTVIDEPAATQSDAGILKMQMRAQSKKQHTEELHVQSIENADKEGAKALDRWIANVEQLHRSKPPPTVQYASPMPQIDELMQVWPDEFERLLGEITLPGAEMDLSLAEYAKLICAIMDIPVHQGNVVQSLHVLFTLWSAFKENQHFQRMAAVPDATAFAGTDYRPSTAAAIEATMQGNDARPSTQAALQAVEGQSDFRPSTAAAIAAVMAAEAQAEMAAAQGHGVPVNLMQNGDSKESKGVDRWEAKSEAKYEGKAGGYK